MLAYILLGLYWLFSGNIAEADVIFVEKWFDFLFIFYYNLASQVIFGSASNLFVLYFF